MPRPREGLPSPEGQTIARKIMESGDQVTVGQAPLAFLVPVAQWGAFSIHIETSGATDFTLDVEWADLDGEIYNDGSNPAVDGTVHLGGTRIRYVITDTEHVGEPFVRVSITLPTGTIEIVNFDMMGDPN